MLTVCVCLWCVVCVCLCGVGVLWTVYVLCVMCVYFGSEAVGAVYCELWTTVLYSYVCGVSGACLYY